MKKIILIFISSLFSSLSFSQITTDILDLSEEPSKFILSDSINETSGVEYYKNFLYTFNDSDGKPEIYKLDSSNGKILQTIKIKNAKNIDWEELAIKDDTLFIGDFGNNLGIRKDLTIYSIKIPETPITTKEIEVPIINKFYFRFEDQKDFKNNEYQKTNFDCEAFIYYKGKLHIFTKQWGNEQTTHYTLDIPKNSNTVQVAKKIETFNTEFAVTGANIYNKELYLIGYTQQGIAYIWKFTNFKEENFFNGNAKKTLIGLIAEIGQTEGISVTKDHIYITGEEMNYSLFNTPPTLYILDKSEL